MAKRYALIFVMLATLCLVTNGASLQRAWKLAKLMTKTQKGGQLPCPNSCLQKILSFNSSA